MPQAEVSDRPSVAWVAGFLTACLLFALFGLYRGCYGPPYGHPDKELRCSDCPVMVK